MMTARDWLVRPLRQWKWPLRLYLIGMCAIHVSFIWMERIPISRGYPDFTVFYTAAAMLRAGMGRHLYSGAAQYLVQRRFVITDWQGPLPFLHPPFEALLFVPFTFLPYPYAWMLWNLCNLAMLVVVIRLLRRHSRTLATISVADCLLFAAAFFPVATTLFDGQDAILLLLCFCLGYDRLARKADFQAGLFFALGLLKFQFAVPLVLLLVFWGMWKTAASFAFWGAVLVAVSLAITGWQGLYDYPRYVYLVGITPGAGMVPPDSLISMPALILGSGLPFPHRFLHAAAVLASVGMFLWAMRAGARLCSGGDGPGAFSLAVLTCILVGYHAHPHDLTILLLPMALLLDRTLPSLGRKSWDWKLALPWLPFLLSPLWFVLWLKLSHLNLLAIPLALLTFALVAAQSQPREAR